MIIITMKKQPVSEIFLNEIQGSQQKVSSWRLNYLFQPKIT